MQHIFLFPFDFRLQLFQACRSGPLSNAFLPTCPVSVHGSVLQGGRNSSGPKDENESGPGDLLLESELLSSIETGGSSSPTVGVVLMFLFCTN